MLIRHMIAFVAAGAATHISAAAPMPALAQSDPDVAMLITRASTAHERLMVGDIDGYRREIRVTPDFILMDPFGGPATGAPSSDEHWKRIGRFFKDGDRSRFQPIRAYRSGGMIVLVAQEHSHVAVGRLPAQDWSLRVTLIFREDEGDWRLAHRHADPLVKGVSLEEAGRLTLGPAREQQQD